jgi:hypothetical protein
MYLSGNLMTFFTLIILRIVIKLKLEFLEVSSLIIFLANAPIIKKDIS